MAKRKTINVDFVKDTVNGYLRDSTCSSEQRLGMCSVLERILHETDNYGGFSYLEKRDVPTGQKPGINYNNGQFIEDYDERFKDTDDTRRKYF